MSKEISRLLKKYFEDKGFQISNNPTIQRAIIMLLCILKIDTENGNKNNLPTFNEVILEKDIYTILLSVAESLTEKGLNMFLLIHSNKEYLAEKDHLNKQIKNNIQLIKDINSIAIEGYIDLLGIIYQLSLTERERQALNVNYPDLKITEYLVKKYLIDNDRERIFNPSGGTGGLGIIFNDVKGTSESKKATCVANINRFLYHSVNNEDFECEDVKNIDKQYNFIYSSLFNSESVVKTRDFIENICYIMKERACLLIPEGSVRKIKTLPKTHDFYIAENLDKDIFYGFNKKRAEVLIINKLIKK